MKEVSIITRTRSCSRQLLIVSSIHFPLPLWIKHWFSFRDHFFIYTQSWNLCRSDFTFWFQEWSCDAVLTSKGTVSFWPWELRSGYVTQVESISHWGLHWTSVLGPPGYTGRETLSIELLDWSCWWLSCHHMWEPLDNGPYRENNKGERWRRTDP